MFTDCTKHAWAGALTHRQQAIYSVEFYTNKTEQYLQNDIKLLCLEETSSLAYNSGETQNFQLFFFTILFGRVRLWRNPRKRVAGGGKL